MKMLTGFFKNVISILKVFFLLICALFLPQFFVWHNQASQTPAIVPTSNQFKLGLENFSQSNLATFMPTKSVKILNVALITNHTGTDQAGNHIIDILQQKGITIKKVFIPHSSKNGNIQLSDASGVVKPAIIKLPAKKVGSLFAAQCFKDIDIVVFDMQDSGMRQYGFITTLLDAMEKAARDSKKFIVLDRPNLLGWCMEGMLPNNTIASVYNVLQVPLRHGMTIGELANYFNKFVLTKSVSLEIIPMQNYDRQAFTHKPLLAGLSANIACIDACYGYSFLGLLGEVAPFDIGVGTDKAFQCLLLPETIKFPNKKWHELRELFKNYGIESKIYRTYSQRKKVYCKGLRLYVQDINRFSSFNTMLAVLKFFKDAGVKLTFSPAFDQTIANDKVRRLLDGKISHNDLALQANSELQSFFKKAFSCFLYKPFPKMLSV